MPTADENGLTQSTHATVAADGANPTRLSREAAAKLTLLVHTAAERGINVLVLFDEDAGLNKILVVYPDHPDFLDSHSPMGKIQHNVPKKNATTHQKPPKTPPKTRL